MKIVFKDKYGDNVSFEDSPDLHKRVFDFLMENYFKKYDCFFGEGIMQSDDPQIYAPEVLADIADNLIKFEVTDSE